MRMGYVPEGHEDERPSLAVFMFATVYWDGERYTTSAVFQHFLEVMKPCFSRIDLCVPVVYSPVPGRELIDAEVVRVLPMVGVETGVQKYFTRFLAQVRDMLRLFLRCHRGWDLVLILDGDVHSQIVYVLTRLFRSRAYLHLRARNELLVQWSGTGGVRAPLAAIFRAWLRFSIPQLVRRLPTAVVGEEMYRMYRDLNPQIHLYVSSSVRAAQLSTGRAMLGPPHRPARLLTVGRVSPSKGLDYLARAVARLPACLPVHVRVVGPAVPMYLQALRCLIDDLNLGGVIELVGPVPFGPQLLRFYADADLYVHPSMMEGTPKVVTEAMAAGLPIVATRVGGIPQLVSDGQTGYLVPPGDIDALTQAIQKVLRDDTRRHAMSHAALKRVREFTLDAQLTRYVQFLVTIFPELQLDVSRMELSGG